MHAKKANPARGAFGTLIERLRQATIDATDFNVPWILFHDELTAAPGFTAEGSPNENPRLRAVVEKVLQRIDASCRCKQSWFLSIDDFSHGMIETTAGTVVLYHFAKEDLGLLGMVGGGRGHLVRFSIAELAAGTLPSKATRGQA